MATGVPGDTFVGGPAEVQSDPSGKRRTGIPSRWSAMPGGWRRSDKIEIHTKNQIKLNIFVFN